MAAAVYNFTLEQGTTYDQTLTWKTQADVPINLTGSTARMQLRQSPESSTALLNLTTENGGITLGGSAGTVRLLITATQTALLTFNVAVYDLEIVSSSGVVTRLMKGSITLDPEVTK